MRNKDPISVNSRQPYRRLCFDRKANVCQKGGNDDNVKFLKKDKTAYITFLLAKISRRRGFCKPRPNHKETQR